MKWTYKFKVSNRLDEPYDEVELELRIKANNRVHAMQIAAQFGFKHHLLLTGPK